MVLRNSRHLTAFAFICSILTASWFAPQSSWAVPPTDDNLFPGYYPFCPIYQPRTNDCKDFTVDFCSRFPPNILFPERRGCYPLLVCNEPPADPGEPPTICHALALTKSCTEEIRTLIPLRYSYTCTYCMIDPQLNIPIYGEPCWTQEQDSPIAPAEMPRDNQADLCRFLENMNNMPCPYILPAFIGTEPLERLKQRCLEDDPVAVATGVCWPFYYSTPSAATGANEMTAE